MNKLFCISFFLFCHSQIVFGENKLNYISDIKCCLGKNLINVVIEIPKNSNEKWEVSKINGKIEKVFFMGKPRIINYGPYPVNYGMIPQTVLPISMGGDGDPLDVILLGTQKERGEVLTAKIVGILSMTDSGEKDDKILAIPKKEYIFGYGDIKFLYEKYPNFDEIIDWFSNYKGNLVVNFRGLYSKEEAIKLVNLAKNYYSKKGIKPR